MMVSNYVLLAFFLTSVRHSSSIEIQQPSSYSPVLAKILSVVDSVTSDINLFEVTLKLLQGICVCMQETLRVKELQLNNNNYVDFLSTDDEKGTTWKQVDLYKRLYNNTCFHLRQELANKFNRTINADEDRKWDVTKCGQNFELTTENVIKLTTLPELHDNIKTQMETILYKSLVQTRNKHKYNIFEQSLYTKNFSQRYNKGKQSMIFIIQLSLKQSNDHKNSKHKNISEKEINDALGMNTTINIDLMDGRHKSKKNNFEDQYLNTASDCMVQSIYAFLIESGRRNELKNFKLLRKKGKIIIYIELILENKHTYFRYLCCDSRLANLLCLNDTSRDEVENKLEKPNLDNYKVTISKIINLVKSYGNEMEIENTTDQLDRNQIEKPELLHWMNTIFNPISVNKNIKERTLNYDSEEQTFSNSYIKDIKETYSDLFSSELSNIHDYRVITTTTNTKELTTPSDSVSSTSNIEMDTTNHSLKQWRISHSSNIITDHTTKTYNSRQKNYKMGVLKLDPKLSSTLSTNNLKTLPFNTRSKLTTVGLSVDIVNNNYNKSLEYDTNIQPQVSEFQVGENLKSTTGYEREIDSNLPILKAFTDNKDYSLFFDDNGKSSTAAIKSFFIDHNTTQKENTEYQLIETITASVSNSTLLDHQEYMYKNESILNKYSIVESRENKTFLANDVKDLAEYYLSTQPGEKLQFYDFQTNNLDIEHSTDLSPKDKVPNSLTVTTLTQKEYTSSNTLNEIFNKVSTDSSPPHKYDKISKISYITEFSSTQKTKVTDLNRKAHRHVILDKNKEIYEFNTKQMSKAKENNKSNIDLKYNDKFKNTIFSTNTESNASEISTNSVTTSKLNFGKERTLVKDTTQKQNYKEIFSGSVLTTAVKYTNTISESVKVTDVNAFTKVNNALNETDILAVNDIRTKRNKYSSDLNHITFSMIDRYSSTSLDATSNDHTYPVNYSSEESKNNKKLVTETTNDLFTVNSESVMKLTDISTIKSEKSVDSIKLYNTITVNDRGLDELHAIKPNTNSVISSKDSTVTESYGLSSTQKKLDTYLNHMTDKSSVLNNKGSFGLNIFFSDKEKENKSETNLKYLNKLTSNIVSTNTKLGTTGIQTDLPTIATRSNFAEEWTVLKNTKRPLNYGRISPGIVLTTILKKYDDPLSKSIELTDVNTLNEQIKLKSAPNGTEIFTMNDIKTKKEKSILYHKIMSTRNKSATLDDNFYPTKYKPKRYGKQTKNVTKEITNKNKSDLLPVNSESLITAVSIQTTKKEKPPYFTDFYNHTTVSDVELDQLKALKPNTESLFYEKASSLTESYKISSAQSEIAPHLTHMTDQNLALETDSESLGLNIKLTDKAENGNKLQVNFKNFTKFTLDYTTDRVLDAKAISTDQTSVVPTTNFLEETNLVTNLIRQPHHNQNLPEFHSTTLDEIFNNAMTTLFEAADVKALSNQTILTSKLNETKYLPINDIQTKLETNIYASDHYQNTVNMINKSTTSSDTSYSEKHSLENNDEKKVENLIDGTTREMTSDSFTVHSERSITVADVPTTNRKKSDYITDLYKDTSEKDVELDQLLGMKLNTNSFISTTEGYMTKHKNVVTESDTVYLSPNSPNFNSQVNVIKINLTSHPTSTYDTENTYYIDNTLEATTLSEIKPKFFSYYVDQVLTKEPLKYQTYNGTDDIDPYVLNTSNNAFHKSTIKIKTNENYSTTNMHKLRPTNEILLLRAELADSSKTHIISHESLATETKNELVKTIETKNYLEPVEGTKSIKKEPVNPETNIEKSYFDSANNMHKIMNTYQNENNYVNRIMYPGFDKIAASTPEVSTVPGKNYGSYQNKTSSLVLSDENGKYTGPSVSLTNISKLKYNKTIQTQNQTTKPEKTSNTYNELFKSNALIKKNIFSNETTTTSFVNYLKEHVRNNLTKVSASKLQRKLNDSKIYYIPFRSNALIKKNVFAKENDAKNKTLNLIFKSNADIINSLSKQSKNNLMNIPTSRKENQSEQNVVDANFTHSNYTASINLLNDLNSTDANNNIANYFTAPLVIYNIKYNVTNNKSSKSLKKSRPDKNVDAITKETLVTKFYSIHKTTRIDDTYQTQLKDILLNKNNLTTESISTEKQTETVNKNMTAVANNFVLPRNVLNNSDIIVTGHGIINMKKLDKNENQSHIITTTTIQLMENAALNSEYILLKHNNDSNEKHVNTDTNRSYFQRYDNNDMTRMANLRPISPILSTKEHSETRLKIKDSAITKDTKDTSTDITQSVQSKTENDKNSVNNILLNKTSRSLITETTYNSFYKDSQKSFGNQELSTDKSSNENRHSKEYTIPVLSGQDAFLLTESQIDNMSTDASLFLDENMTTITNNSKNNLSHSESLFNNSDFTLTVPRIVNMKEPNSIENHANITTIAATSLKRNTALHENNKEFILLTEDDEYNDSNKFLFPINAGKNNISGTKTPMNKRQSILFEKEKIDFGDKTQKSSTKEITKETSTKMRMSASTRKTFTINHENTSFLYDDNNIKRKHTSEQSEDIETDINSNFVNYEHTVPMSIITADYSRTTTMHLDYSVESSSKEDMTKQLITNTLQSRSATSTISSDHLIIYTSKFSGGIGNNGSHENVDQTGLTINTNKLPDTKTHMTIKQTGSILSETEITYTKDKTKKSNITKATNESALELKSAVTQHTFQTYRDNIHTKILFQQTTNKTSDTITHVPYTNHILGTPDKIELQVKPTGDEFKYTGNRNNSSSKPHEEIIARTTLEAEKARNQSSDISEMIDKKRIQTNSIPKGVTSFVESDKITQFKLLNNYSNILRKSPATLKKLSEEKDTPTNTFKLKNTNNTNRDFRATSPLDQNSTSIPQVYQNNFTTLRGKGTNVKNVNLIKIQNTQNNYEILTRKHTSEQSENIEAIFKPNFRTSNSINYEDTVPISIPTEGYSRTMHSAYSYESPSKEDMSKQQVTNTLLSRSTTSNTYFDHPIIYSSKFSRGIDNNGSNESTGQTGFTINANNLPDSTTYTPVKQIGSVLSATAITYTENKTKEATNELVSELKLAVTKNTFQANRDTINSTTLFQKATNKSSVTVSYLPYTNQYLWITTDTVLSVEPTKDEFKFILNKDVNSKLLIKEVTNESGDTIQDNDHEYNNIRDTSPLDQNSTSTINVYKNYFTHYVTSTDESLNAENKTINYNMINEIETQQRFDNNETKRMSVQSNDFESDLFPNSRIITNYYQYNTTFPINTKNSDLMTTIHLDNVYENDNNKSMNRKQFSQHTTLSPIDTASITFPDVLTINSQNNDALFANSSTIANVGETVSSTTIEMPSGQNPVSSMVHANLISSKSGIIKMSTESMFSSSTKAEIANNDPTKKKITTTDKTYTKSILKYKTTSEKDNIKHSNNVSTFNLFSPIQDISEDISNLTTFNVALPTTTAINPKTNYSHEERDERDELPNSMLPHKTLPTPVILKLMILNTKSNMYEGTIGTESLFSTSTLAEKENDGIMNKTINDKTVAKHILSYTTPKEKIKINSSKKLFFPNQDNSNNTIYLTTSNTAFTTATALDPKTKIYTDSKEHISKTILPVAKSYQELDAFEKIIRDIMTFSMSSNESSLENPFVDDRIDILDGLKFINISEEVKNKDIDSKLNVNATTKNKANYIPTTDLLEVLENKLTNISTKMKGPHPLVPSSMLTNQILPYVVMRNPVISNLVMPNENTDTIEIRTKPVFSTSTQAEKKNVEIKNKKTITRLTDTKRILNYTNTNKIKNIRNNGVYSSKLFSPIHDIYEDIVLSTTSNTAFIKATTLDPKTKLHKDPKEHSYESTSPVAKNYQERNPFESIHDEITSFSTLSNESSEESSFVDNAVNILDNVEFYGSKKEAEDKKRITKPNVNGKARYGTKKTPTTDLLEILENKLINIISGESKGNYSFKNEPTTIPNQERKEFDQNTEDLVFGKLENDLYSNQTAKNNYFTTLHDIKQKSTKQTPAGTLVNNSGTKNLNVNSVTKINPHTKYKNVFNQTVFKINSTQPTVPIPMMPMHVMPHPLLLSNSMVPNQILPNMKMPNPMISNLMIPNAIIRNPMISNPNFMLPNANAAMLNYPLVSNSIMTNSIIYQKDPNSRWPLNMFEYNFSNTRSEENYNIHSEKTSSQTKEQLKIDSDYNSDDTYSIENAKVKNPTKSKSNYDNVKNPLIFPSKKWNGSVDLPMLKKKLNINVDNFNLPGNILLKGKETFQTTAAISKSNNKSNYKTVKQNKQKIKNENTSREDNQENRKISKSNIKDLKSINTQVYIKMTPKIRKILFTYRPTKTTTTASPKTRLTKKHTIVYNTFQPTPRELDDSMPVDLFSYRDRPIFPTYKYTKLPTQIFFLEDEQHDQDLIHYNALVRSSNFRMKYTTMSTPRLTTLSKITEKKRNLKRNRLLSIKYVTPKSLSRVAMVRKVTPKCVTLSTSHKLPMNITTKPRSTKLRNINSKLKPLMPIRVLPHTTTTESFPRATLLRNVNPKYTTLIQDRVLINNPTKPLMPTRVLPIKHTTTESFPRVTLLRNVNPKYTPLIRDRVLLTNPTTKSTTPILLSANIDNKHDRNVFIDDALERNSHRRIIYTTIPSTSWTTLPRQVTDWWLDDMYLKVRLPLPINSNPGMVFPSRRFAKMEEVADLGALFIDDLLDYKEMLDRGELPLERATSREKGQPLCMEQFYRLLGVCRIAEAGKDRLEFPPVRQGEGEELVVVACRNYFYPIPVKAADRGRLTAGEIQAQLLHAMVDAGGAPSAPKVGLLTSMNRDQWAKAREILIKDENNRANLELISRALCILCLDEEGGNLATDPDTSSMLRAMHGAGTKYHSANRWFDKTVQLIISSDGTVGMCYEHSAAEGVAVVRLAERALARAEVAERPAPPPTLLPAPQVMKWNLTPEIHRTIELAGKELDRQISNLDFKVYTYKGYGREFMKSCKTSPDVYIQLALQYAYYKMYGYLVSTYESASLRRFRDGRVDNIRSAHKEAKAWAAAMCTAENSPMNELGDDGQKKVSFNLYGEQKKLELFEAAARKQTEIMEANIQGRGIDNHLLGLREAARETLGELPPIFTDSTYKQMIEFKLSTSQVATTTDGTYMGYGAVVPDGYGCSYNPKKESVIFSIASFVSSTVTNNEAFRQSLEEALDSMKLMFQNRKVDN